MCQVYSKPHARFGRNFYCNLVSCRIECNTRKGDRPAPDFRRTLYRLGRTGLKTGHYKYRSAPHAGRTRRFGFAP